MSGPGGSQTKRDQRRATRQQQYQQRQQERQRARQRAIQRQRITRGAIIGGIVLVLIIVAIILSQTVFHASGKSTGNTSGSTTVLSGVLNASPATGQTVDGLTCDPSQGGVGGQHLHQYLDLYVNGKRVTAEPGAGIVDAKGCLYPLHIHDGEPDVIHVETASATANYTLGQFFDIWGVKLSSTQVGQYQTDSAHQLVIKIIDANGAVSTYTGDPRQIPLRDKETIYVLYNSPNVQLTPFTNWDTLKE